MAWHDIGIPARQDWNVVEVAGTTVLVVDVNGSWVAVEDRCSHAGCAFSTDGELDGETLICNCHGAEFDIRSGEVTRMPARELLRLFPTRTVGPRVEVEL